MRALQFSVLPLSDLRLASSPAV
jgi:hypothetical protein